MTTIPPLASPITSSPSAAADTSRLATKDNLAKAATQFEAVFINQMLKSARAAKLDDGLFDSDAGDHRMRRMHRDRMRSPGLAQHERHRHDTLQPERSHMTPDSYAEGVALLKHHCHEATSALPRLRP